MKKINYSILTIMYILSGCVDNNQTNKGQRQEKAGTNQEKSQAEPNKKEDEVKKPICLNLASSDNKKSNVDLSDILDLPILDFEDIVQKAKNTRESKGRIVRDEKIVEGIKLGNTYKLRFSNLPVKTRQISIRWLHTNSTFVTYSLKNNEDFLTQAFDFENLPLISITVKTEDLNNSTGMDTYGVYYVDLSAEL